MLITMNDLLRAELAITGAQVGSNGMKREALTPLQEAIDRVRTDLNTFGTIPAPPPLGDEQLREIKAARRAGSARSIHAAVRPRELRAAE